LDFPYRSYPSHQIPQRQNSSGRRGIPRYTESHSLPYLILVVDLDTQKGKPTPDEALRVVAKGL